MCQPLALVEPLEEPQFRTRSAFTIDQFDDFAVTQSASSLAQNTPKSVGRWDNKQSLPASARTQSAASQLCRAPLGIIQHEPIATRKQVGQIADMLVQNL